MVSSALDSEPSFHASHTASASWDGGPPRRDFREINREAMLDGVIQNMITPLELIKAVMDGMAVLT